MISIGAEFDARHELARTSRLTSVNVLVPQSARQTRAFLSSRPTVTMEAPSALTAKARTPPSWNARTSDPPDPVRRSHTCTERILVQDDGPILVSRYGLGPARGPGSSARILDNTTGPGLFPAGRVPESNRAIGLGGEHVLAVADELCGPDRPLPEVSYRPFKAAGPSPGRRIPDGCGLVPGRRHKSVPSGLKRAVVTGRS